MKKWFFLLAVVILGLLQLTLLNYFKIFNLKPDLLLITVIIASLLLKKEWALFFSAFAGVFKDVFSATTFGLNTLLFPMWCFLIMTLAKKISLDSNLIRIVLIFIVAFLHNTIIGFIFITLKGYIPVGLFLRIIFVESLYTALVLPLVFRIIRSFYFHPLLY